MFTISSGKWSKTLKVIFFNKKFGTPFVDYRNMSTFTRGDSHNRCYLKELITFAILQKCSKRFLMASGVYESQLTNTDVSQFSALLPVVINHLMHNEILKEMPEVADRYKMALQYNLNGGKKLRAMALISSYRLMSSNKLNQNEEITNAYILGWCVELFHSFELIVDDVLDNSQSRRGRPTWFFQNDKQLVVVYDGIMLYESIYTILEKYISKKHYYPHIIETFREVAFRTNSGQILDNMTSKKIKQNIPLVERFTSKIYDKIVLNKTSYYTYYLPIVLAWYMVSDVESIPTNNGIHVGQEHHKTKENIKKVALQIGHLMQVQDDYLDCYGSPSLTGKSDTDSDIAQGKCSWLITTALIHADEYQRQSLEENYGKPDEKSISAVKALFNEISVESKFKQHEENQITLIKSQITELFDSVILQKLFTDILFTICGRKH